MSTIEKNATGTVGWFDLGTSDMAAAREFYGQLFGWTFDIGPAELGHYTMCKLRDQLAAGMGPLMPGSDQPPTWSVYFISEDAEATAARMVEAGGKVVVPPMTIPESGRMMVATDAAGAMVGVWQPNRHGGFQVHGEHGSKAWSEVNVRDADAAIEFYRAVFGVESRKIDGMDYWTLHQGDITFGGILQMEGSHIPATVPPHWTPYFVVDDVDAACALITSLGGKIRVPGFDSPYGRMAMVADPQGAGFTIMAPVGNPDSAGA